MKKFLLIISLFIFTILSAYSSIDEYSEAYLKSKKHFSLITPIAETITSNIIKSIIKSEISGKYKVKCKVYNISSLKRGILKNLDIKGKDVIIEGIKIPILNMKTLTDYNKIDYLQNHPVICSDIIFDYYAEINESTLKNIVNSKRYRQQIEKVNYILSPLILVENIDIFIINNKIKINITYNLPFKKYKSSQVCSITTSVKIFNNKIRLFSDNIDKNYTKYQLAKVINLLDPFNFNAELLKNKKCNIKVEHVNIIDNIIRINGRIYVEADKIIEGIRKENNS